MFILQAITCEVVLKSKPIQKSVYSLPSSFSHYQYPSASLRCNEAVGIGFLFWFILKAKYTEERQDQIVASHSPCPKKTHERTLLWSKRFKGYCLLPVWIQCFPPHVVFFLKKIMSTCFTFFFTLLHCLGFLFFLSVHGCKAKIRFK